MDPRILALIAIRAAALSLSLAGQTKAANALYTLADAYEAGRVVDEHMAAVAARLKERPVTEADWEDVVSRIEADSDRLQNG